MFYQAIVISLIVAEGLLMLISIAYFRRLQLASKEFTAVFSEYKNDRIILHNQLKDLTTVINKEEDNKLKMIFCLQDIDRSVAKILLMTQDFQNIVESSDSKKQNND